VLWKLGCCDLRRRNRRFSSLHGMLNPTSSILLPTCRAVRTPTNARIPAGDRRFLLLYGIQTPSPANPLSPQGNASQPWRRPCAGRGARRGPAFLWQYRTLNPLPR
jgi:hypothetical protein